MTTEDDNIDIRRYIGVFLSYWPLMILLPILGGMAGYFFQWPLGPCIRSQSDHLSSKQGQRVCDWRQ